MVLATLAHILLPGSCASCTAPAASPLCDACAARICWIQDACDVCAVPKLANRVCGECATRRHVFTRAASAAMYGGPLKDAVVAFKVLGERRAARTMATWLLRAARRLPDPGAITWVPSTRRSDAERGFTPAKEIAVAFAGLVARRPVVLLEKVRDTHDQHALTIEQRFANQRDAFRARPAKGHVLVVDDVLTTGATANACARALLRAGAADVSILTLGRARRKQVLNTPFPRLAPGSKIGNEGTSGSVVAAEGASWKLSRGQWQAKRPT